MDEDTTLSAEELDSLLAGAEIISDDSGYVTDEEGFEPLLEDVQVKPTKEPFAEVKEKEQAPPPIDIVEVGNFTPQQKHNAELLMDIYVQVTVELGRTTIRVEDVLGLGEGSIIELYKPANEPVDLLVNNRLIAHGEVVVIDENFGARVTNIVSPLDRIL